MSHSNVAAVQGRKEQHALRARSGLDNVEKYFGYQERGYVEPTTASRGRRGLTSHFYSRLLSVVEINLFVLQVRNRDGDVLYYNSRLPILDASEQFGAVHREYVQHGSTHYVQGYATPKL